jgi:hypothetical protein
MSPQTLSQELFSVCIHPGAPLVKRCSHSLQQTGWIDDKDAIGFDDDVTSLERELR